ncbi:hypothetical protein BI024_gp24 [Streptomyces phage Nanodon]|uniref:Uncharacterized protein n=1 Tax=Streptomyces phage Nanodon TaxID=1873777 RepID=A0A1B1PAA2_9CAUD|nr:hypothetical protein BI024_gp24 [Streptomyces phage Nanodon]ANT41094.1 hypothetical protein SEA_NANODON_24 [Streptomyces phage Nanodon]
MALTVYPYDEGSVGPTGPEGPMGPKGDKGDKGDTGNTGATGATGAAGANGSQTLRGTTAPSGATGVNGDWYIQEDTRTFLGVTSTTFTLYRKESGAWVQHGSNLGGSKWYTNNTSTSSTDTKPGDMLLRTDTGDIWQRSETGWGSPIGNLKGPKGDTGDTGPQGPQGIPGDGAVSTVNSVSPDVNGNVQLTPGDVGALATTGGTLTGAVTSTPSTGHGLTVYGSSDTSKYFRVTDAGHPYSNSLRATFYNMGVGDTATQFGGGTFVLGVKNATTVPTTAPTNGVYLWSEAGKLKLKGVDGNTVELNDSMPKTGGTFTADFSLEGASGSYRQWSLDVGGAKRWTFQKDDVVEPGDGSGSNLRISSRNDDGTFKSTILFADRGTGQVAIGTTSPYSNTKLSTPGAIGMKDIGTDPTTASGGAAIYSKSGIAYIKQGDGTVFSLSDAVDLSGNQTITGTKTFSNRPVFNDGVTINGVGGIQAAWKTAATSRTSTTTATADPHLVLSTVANGVYEVELNLAWTNGGGGLRVTWTGPSGATLVWTDNDGYGFQAISNVCTFNATTGATIKGLLRNSSSAGNLTMLWAQNTSNAAGTSLASGCYLKLTRLA